MSALRPRLERIKENFLKQAPAEAVHVMEQATNELRASGILSRLPKIGSPIPGFALEDMGGTVVHSGQLLRKGPLILTFYRGLW